MAIGEGEGAGREEDGDQTELTFHLDLAGLERHSVHQKVVGSIPCQGTSSVGCFGPKGTMLHSSRRPSGLAVPSHFTTCEVGLVFRVILWP